MSDNLHALWLAFEAAMCEDALAALEVEQEVPGDFPNTGAAAAADVLRTGAKVR